MRQRNSMVQVVHGLLVAAIILAMGLAPACGGGGRSSDIIQGQIGTTRDQADVPVAQAQVMIRPLTVDPEQKGADEQPEDPVNLRGVAITNDSGFFSVKALSSDQTFQEYGLLRNWKYEITIQVPGYYMYRGTFGYGKAGQELAVQLEEKSTDVLDESGVIQIDERAIQTGAIRRGN